MQSKSVEKLHSVSASETEGGEARSATPLLTAMSRPEDTAQNMPVGEIAPDGRSLPDSLEAPSAQYREAFRSTGIIGGASALTMAIGLGRAKAMAVLLGPAGTGLMGLYGQVTNLMTVVSGFGISASGVREIAAASGQGDELRLAEADLTVRRFAWAAGLLGMLLQLALCLQFSQWTFGTHVHWQAIAWLSVVPLLQSLTLARVARIQGLRRIGDLARQNVLSALIGTVSAVALIWFFRFDGIVPQLVVVAAIGLALSSHYARKLAVPHLRSPLRASLPHARGMVGLGFSVMASTLVGMLAFYVVSVMISRRLGVEANGLYFAAWSLSGLYANFILDAMSTDYYPRLSAVADDPGRLRPMVNQQAEVALLIGTPGIVGTLVFAPLAIQVFYTGAYSGAFDVMRWLILGVFLKLVSWPLGYILLAKGASGPFLATESLHQLLNVVLVSVLIGPLGLPGVGISLAALHVVRGIAVLVIVSRYFGFGYTAQYTRLLGCCLALTVAAFLLPAIPLAGPRYVVGAGLTAVACVFCAVVLKRMMDLGSVRQVLDTALRLSGLKRRTASR